MHAETANHITRPFAFANPFNRHPADRFKRRVIEGAAVSLHRDAILIRCIVENKDGWCCEDRGGRDFCPAHVQLANPSRISQPTPRAVADL